MKLFKYSDFLNESLKKLDYLGDFDDYNDLESYYKHSDEDIMAYFSEIMDEVDEEIKISKYDGLFYEKAEIEKKFEYHMQLSIKFSIKMPDTGKTELNPYISGKSLREYSKFTEKKLFFLKEILKTIEWIADSKRMEISFNFVDEFVRNDYMDLHIQTRLFEVIENSDLFKVAKPFIK